VPFLTNGTFFISGGHMNHFLLTIGILGLSLQSFAGSLPGLSEAYTRHLSQTRARLIQSQLLQAPHPGTCHRQILNLSQKNQINIMLAFGYMDVSLGQDFEDSATHLYGPGDVLDRDAKMAMENMLMSSCQSRQNFACGFRRRGHQLQKTIRDRFSNRRITISVTLVAPSVSVSDHRNRTTLASRQQQLSAQSRSQFLSSFQSHDVVLYLGHARSGGGPDFYPPVLLNNGRVNYGHYRSEQDGIRGMVSQLRSAPEQPAIIGLLACKSTGLFAQRVRSVAPQSILVTADNLFDYNDILPTGYAMLEAIISQRCTDNFESVVKTQPASQRFLRLFF
jgi:hypothetical protein